MVAKIISILPLVCREYQDRDGRPQVFKSKGFIFDDGRNTIYAEALQELAQFFEEHPLSPNDSVIVHTVCRARSFKDSQGNERYSNEVTISNIKVL